MIQEIEQILRDLEYPIKKCSNYIQTAAKWREGQDPTSVVIYDKCAVDFVTGDKMSLGLFLARILNLDTEEKAKEWLKNKNYNIDFSELKNQYNKSEKINQPVYFDESEILKLEQNHNYWTNRGISEFILREFRGGVCKEGKLKNRYVFPIFNKDNKIIGLQGRTLINSQIKYKIIGQKGGFVFPNNNDNIIKQQNKVIIVEGIGCVLSLYEAGIRNCKCNFGTDMSLGLLNYLLRISPKQIIISLNNEKSGIGQAASEKLQRRLWKYFDKKQILINLPKNKDFNEWLLTSNGKKEIIEWYNKL